MLCVEIKRGSMYGADRVVPKLTNSDIQTRGVVGVNEYLDKNGKAVGYSLVQTIYPEGAYLQMLLGNYKGKGENNA